MKRIITYFIIIAVSVLASSCKKNNQAQEHRESSKVKVLCTATLEDRNSKVVFGSLSDDKWSRFLTQNNILVMMASTNVYGEFSDFQTDIVPLVIASGAQSASATPKFYFEPQHAYNMFYALSPASQYVEGSLDLDVMSLQIDLPSTQTMPVGLDTPDEKIVITTSAPGDDAPYVGIPKQVNLNFNCETECTKYFNVKFKGLPAGIQVSSVDVKFGGFHKTGWEWYQYCLDNEKMLKVAGRYKLFVYDYTPDSPIHFDWRRWEPVGELSDTIHIIPNKNDGVWFGIHSMVRTECRDITFTVHSDLGDFSKVIRTNSDKYLIPGNVASLSIDFELEQGNLGNSNEYDWDVTVL